MAVVLRRGCVWQRACRGLLRGLANAAPGPASEGKEGDEKEGDKGSEGFGQKAEANWKATWEEAKGRLNRETVAAAAAKVQRGATAAFGVAAEEVRRASQEFTEEYRKLTGGEGKHGGSGKLRLLGVYSGKPTGPLSDATDMAVVEDTSREGVSGTLGRIWDRLTALVPKSVKEVSSKTSEKLSDLGEDVRERWETSESPMVHAIQDRMDGVFNESESAICMNKIQMYDRDFNVVQFLNKLQYDVTPVLTAFLKNDDKVLKQCCSKDLYVRGIQHVMLQEDFTTLAATGHSVDSTVLNVGEVELLGMEMLDEVPHLLVRVQTQQIYCIRDSKGRVVKGAEDDIRSMFYVWSIMMDVEEEGENIGRPKWLIRAIAVQGNIPLPA